ncbi:FMN-binding protein [Candidatus Hydrogenedentota bacterium]
MKDNLYTLFYALVLGIVCALILTIASEACRDRQAANAEAEKTWNVLTVLGVEFGEDASAQELLDLAKEVITETGTDDLTLYEYRDGDKLFSAAAPFDGPALWGPVEGFIALEPDMNTIKAISFYKQEETPGLGGEIGAPWFQEQFKGKTLKGLHFVKGGKALAANEVDSISGATITCDKVQAMIYDIGAKISSLSK